jgi:hypothetical protein
MSDQIYTVEDYWDGPREGFATFEGRPHHYKSIFDESEDDWTQTFRLTPIEPDILPLVLEAWGIWSRWKEAFDAGKTTLASHPALPEDKARADYLVSVISEFVPRNESRSFVARGEFHSDPQGVTWHVAAA